MIFITRTETLAILGVLKAAYPGFYKDQNEYDAKMSVNLWHEMFADDNAEIVSNAVKAFIATDKKGYPPVIGGIKNKIAELKTQTLNNPGLTEFEAWNLVKKAIGNGIYGASEEFAELPPDLQNLVGSPNQLCEWAKMPSETVESVVGSNFMRSYRIKFEYNREEMLLPSDVKKFIAELAAKIPVLPAKNELCKTDSSIIK